AEVVTLEPASFGKIRLLCVRSNSCWILLSCLQFCRLPSSTRSRMHITYNAKAVMITGCHGPTKPNAASKTTAIPIPVILRCHGLNPFNKSVPRYVVYSSCEPVASYYDGAIQRVRQKLIDGLVSELRDSTTISAVANVGGSTSDNRIKCLF